MCESASEAVRRDFLLFVWSNLDALITVRRLELFNVKPDFRNQMPRNTRVECIYAKLPNGLVDFGSRFSFLFGGFSFDE